MAATRRVGRPPGANTGRVPVGGYPLLEPSLSGFLAGFIEGEGCLSISRQAGRRNCACSMSLECRDDDTELLTELAMRTRLGTLTSRSGKGRCRPQTRWTVGAKADVLRLTEILDSAPLRGQKSGVYSVWRAATRCWIHGDPTMTRIRRDWTSMEYLRGRLSDSKSFASRGVSLIDSTDGLGADWGHYLAGFATAEGSFGIVSTGQHGRYKVVFQVRLRRDDVELLRQLRARADAGRVYLEAKRVPGRCPAAAWSVFSAQDISRLVAVFDRFHLKGRKQREFEVWREAALLFASDRPRPQIHRRLAILRDQLIEARQYRSGLGLT